MKKIVIFLFLSLAVNGWSAEVYDLIYMRDGTVLKGFISEQQMNGNICITFTSATYSLSKDQVIIGHNARSVRMGSKEYNNVEILETGDIVTFKVDFPSPETMSTRITEIVKTERAIIDHIIDVIVTRDELLEYKGHIIEVVRGKCVKMLVDDKVIVIRQDNILQQRREPDQETALIIPNSPLVETYALKDGSYDNGLLVSQNFETGIIEFISNSGYKSKWNISEVNRVKRDKNPKYQEPDDKILKVNNLPFTMSVAHVKDGDVSLPARSQIVGNAKAGSVEIEMTRNAWENYVLMPFNPLNREKKSDFIRVFNLSDVEETTISGTVIREGEKTMTVSYELEPGYYVLFDQNTLMVLPLWVY